MRPDIYAPNIWNRVRMEAETKLDDEEIEKALAKTEKDNLIDAMSMQVGKSPKDADVIDIPPARKKPIPYAVSPERLDTILLEHLPAQMIRRSDILPIAAGCYLNAGRIKEALQVRVSDVSITAVEGREFLNFNLMTEKRKKKKNKEGVMVKPIPPRRLVPVAMKGGFEEKLVQVFMKHFEKFSGEEFLFCLSKEEAVLIDRTNIKDRLLDRERGLAHYYFSQIDFGPLKIKKYYAGKGYVEEISDVYRGFPHYMRHVRLTHLSSLYGVPDLMLKDIAGWTTTAMAPTYVHLDSSDIAAHMLKRIDAMKDD